MLLSIALILMVGMALGWICKYSGIHCVGYFDRLGQRLDAFKIFCEGSYQRYD